MGIMKTFVFKDNKLVSVTMLRLRKKVGNIEGSRITRYLDNIRLRIFWVFAPRELFLVKFSFIVSVWANIAINRLIVSDLHDSLKTFISSIYQVVLKYLIITPFFNCKFKNVGFSDPLNLKFLRKLLRNLTIKRFPVNYNTIRIT